MNVKLLLVLITIAAPPLMGQGNLLLFTNKRFYLQTVFQFVVRSLGWFIS